MHEQGPEQIQVAVTQEDIRVIKHDLKNLSERFSEVHLALIGNSLGKDGGLIRRIEKAENDLAEIEARVETVERIKLKTDVYQRIAIFLVGGAASASIIALFRYFFN